MEDLSDDELNVVYTKGAAPAVSTARRVEGFSLDDAFSDTDDNEVGFDFSPAALREELHKSISHDTDWNLGDDVEDFANKIGYSVDHETDTSVSTFDINASVHDEPISPPTQQPPSPDSQTLSQPSRSQPDSLSDVQLASDFSTVSLSDHASTPPEPEPEPDKSDEEEVEVKQEHVVEHAYPAVQIEVHDDTHALATVQEVAIPPAEYHIPDHQSKPSQDSINAIQSITPRSSTSVASESSVTVPIPSSSSLPTPSSAQSTTSVASTASTRHRPTKSLGPSALDKVISKTRPHFLPPKPRTEDKKHMADWEKMMKQSRLAGESILFALCRNVNEMFIGSVGSLLTICACLLF